MEKEAQKPADQRETPDGPLLEGCECYTCQNYTRSYIFHLFDVKEMNANILLAIHNSWVYDHHLFGEIRKYLPF